MPENMERVGGKENRPENYMQSKLKKTKRKREDPLEEIRKMLREVRKEMKKYSQSLEVG